MNTVGSTTPRDSNLDLPPFSLDIEALDLGPDISAVGLELLETESREPLRGTEAAEIWAALFPSLAGKEPLVLDFFSHVDRVRDFCQRHEIAFREGADRCLVLRQPSEEYLKQLIARFETETFGLRVGIAAEAPDEVLENQLSHRGLDAYQAAYLHYTFCAVCEPEDGWVTLLSNTLWPSEVIRRVRPAAQRFDIYLSRPH